MPKAFWRGCVAVVLLLVAACVDHPGPPVANGLTATLQRLAPLHRTLGEPQSGDWLDSHKEKGQSFVQYTRSAPIRPKGKRRVLYVQPIGTMSKAHAGIVGKTAEHLGLYFGVRVQRLPAIPSSVVPATERRAGRGFGEQWRTGFILDKVLVPKLPQDAVAMLGITVHDLWPGDGWNFVFGQASLSRRVGVWSMARNGDPQAGEAQARLCLLRTLKTAAHETGHMFSMPHCIAYECNMCGSNSREESDRRWIALCPECLGKVVWGMSIDPVGRFRALQAFYRREALVDEADHCAASLVALR